MSHTDLGVCTVKYTRKINLKEFKFKLIGETVGVHLVCPSHFQQYTAMFKKMDLHLQKKKKKLPHCMSHDLALISVRLSSVVQLYQTAGLTLKVSLEHSSSTINHIKCII